MRISTVVVVFFAVLVLFGLVAFHALIVRHQTHIDALNAEIAASQRARQELHLAVAQLEAPDRIRAEAIGRFGMVEPIEVTYLEPISAALIAAVATEAPETDEPGDGTTGSGESESETDSEGDDDIGLQVAPQDRD